MNDGPTVNYFCQPASSARLVQTLATQTNHVQEEIRIVLISLWQRSIVSQLVCSKGDANSFSLTGFTAQRSVTVEALYERLNKYHLVMVWHLRNLLRRRSNPIP